MTAPGTKTIVRPPGPFLPVGRPTVGVIDLGALVRDELFTRAHVRDRVRPALHRRLAKAAHAGELALAAELVRAFLDSWPVAHRIDASRVAWTGGAFDGRTLPTLARAAQLIALAEPELSMTDGRWPVPDAEWIRARAGVGPHLVVRRHAEDAARVVAEALGASVRPGVDADLELPPVLSVDGAELAARRREVGSSLAAGEYEAVRFTGPVPADVESQLALAEVRLEASAQRAIERHGLAGLLAPDAPPWSDVLDAAPPGQSSARLAPVAEGIVLPGPPAALERGEASEVGYIVWDAPLRWIAVEPVAIEVLERLDDEPEPARLARALEAPVEAVRAICNELVRLGAATAR